MCCSLLMSPPLSPLSVANDDEFRQKCPLRVDEGAERGKRGERGEMGERGESKGERRKRGKERE